VGGVGGGEVISKAFSLVNLHTEVYLRERVCSGKKEMPLNTCK